MQPAVRRVAEDFCGEPRRERLRAQRRRHSITDHHELNFAGAPHGESALAVVRRLDRPEHRQRPFRLRNFSERLRDPAQRFGFVELAGNDQYRVIGLVVHPVERLQIRDAHILDVRARTDR